MPEFEYVWKISKRFLILHFGHYMSRLDHGLELLEALVANRTVSDNGVYSECNSFNCRGFRSSEDHIRVLADILCLQEHWLLKDSLIYLVM